MTFDNGSYSNVIVNSLVFSDYGGYVAITIEQKLKLK